jgi:hypothetical protein
VASAGEFYCALQEKTLISIDEPNFGKSLNNSKINSKI